MGQDQSSVFDLAAVAAASNGGNNDPLLPPTDKVSYAVRFRVNIQKWATLPKQVWNWN